MSVRLVYHLCILRDAIIAVTVAVVSLTGIVQKGNDADTFIGKRYIQLVTFITELLPQKVPGGVLAEILGRGVRPPSQNPYPIYDQNLRFFPTLFMT